MPPEAPRSSFIPKQTSSAMPLSVKRRRSFHVFGFLATVLLVTSIISAGGAYLYKNYSVRDLDKQREDLRVVSEKYGDEKYNEVRNFNRQLLAVRFLLDQHLSPSKFFDQLELSTMQRIQFTNFEFEYDPGFEVILRADGGTEEFKTVALQALQFDNQPLLKDMTFTDLSSGNVDQENPGASTNATFDHEVGFTINGVVSPEFLLYEGTDPISETAAPAIVETQTETQP